MPLKIQRSAERLIIIAEVKSFTVPQIDIVHHNEIPRRIAHQLRQLRPVMDALKGPVRLKLHGVQRNPVAVVIHIQLHLKLFIRLTVKRDKLIKGKRAQLIRCHLHLHLSAAEIYLLLCSVGIHLPYLQKDLPVFFQNQIVQLIFHVYGQGIGERIDISRSQPCKAVGIQLVKPQKTAAPVVTAVAGFYGHFRRALRHCADRTCKIIAGAVRRCQFVTGTVIKMISNTVHAIVYNVLFSRRNLFLCQDILIVVTRSRFSLHKSLRLYFRRAVNFFLTVVQHEAVRRGVRRNTCSRIIAQQIKPHIADLPAVAALRYADHIVRRADIKQSGFTIAIGFVVRHFPGIPVDLRRLRRIPILVVFVFIRIERHSQRIAMAVSPGAVYIVKASCFYRDKGAYHPASRVVSPRIRHGACAAEVTAGIPARIVQPELIPAVLLAVLLRQRIVDALENQTAA